MIAPVHALRVQFVIAPGRRGEGAATARRNFILLAAGGRRPVIGQLQRANLFLEDKHALGQRTAVRLADIEKEIEILQHLRRQAGL